MQPADWKKSLFDGAGMHRPGKWPSREERPQTYRECADALDVTIRECGAMEARCRERLLEAHRLFEPLPKDRRDVEKLSKEDPRFNRCVPEEDWRRAREELKHFLEMRAWYRRQVDAGMGDKPVQLRAKTLDDLPGDKPADITDEEIPF